MLWKMFSSNNISMKCPFPDTLDFIDVEFKEANLKRTAHAKKSIKFSAEIGQLISAMLFWNVIEKNHTAIISSYICSRQRPFVCIVVSWMGKIRLEIETGSNIKPTKQIMFAMCKLHPNSKYNVRIVFNCDSKLRQQFIERCIPSKSEHHKGLGV